MEILHHLASGYGKRPSELVGIDDEIAALNLDACVLILGSRAEQRAYEERRAEEDRSGSGSSSGNIQVNKKPLKNKRSGRAGSRQATRSDWLSLGQMAKR